MADLLDQIHAQQTKPGGDLLDQVHAQQQPPAIKEPEGSAASRFGSGLWDTTIGGLGHMAAGTFDLLRQAITNNPGMPVDPMSPGGQMIGNLVMGHVEQARKAKEALDRGDHIEALGHTLATITPLIGPAAAHAGERMGGSAPVFDKYGKVIEPGQAPDVAGGLGEATGLVGMAAAPEIAARVLPKNTPTVGSKLNPVEQSAVDLLESRGIPLTAGTKTGNKFVRSAEAVTRHSPLGAPEAADFDAGTEAGLQRVAGELRQEAAPGQTTTPEQAGAALAARLKGNIDVLTPQREAAYQDAWQGRGEAQHTEMVPVRMRQVENPDAPGQMIDEPVMKPVNMPVDVRDIKAQAEPILEEMSWMPAADRASNAGFAALEKITKGDDFIPAWSAEKGLSGLKDMARLTGKQIKTGMRDTGQGIAASLVGDLQDGIDAAVAKTGDAAIQGLQNARATHARMVGIGDLAERLRDEPVEVYNQMTKNHDVGIDLARQMQEQAPDVLPRIGQAWVHESVERAMQEGGFSKTVGILNDWRKLGPETKKLFFPDPELRSALGDFFKGADMVKVNVNPSGTALVKEATSVNPMRWAAGYLGGKMLFTPGGIRLLTEGIRQNAGPLPQMMATRALDQMGGPEPPAEPPPGSPPPPAGPAGTPPAGAAPAGGANPLADIGAQRQANQQAFIDKAKAAGGAGDITLYRGAPDPEFGKGDFPGTFFATDEKTAAQYGPVHRYTIAPKRLLNIDAPEAAKLSEEFLRKHPDEAANYDPELDGPTSPDLWMFPPERWVKYLKSQGYEGTSIGKDLFLFDPSEARHISGPAQPSELAPAGRSTAAGQPAPSATPTAPGGSISDTLQNTADSAMQRMRDRGTFSGTKLNAAVPVDDLADMAIWGAAKIAKGTVDFAKWSREMVADAGEQIRPQLQQMYDQSQKIYERHVANTAGKLATTKQLLKMYKIGEPGKDWYKNTQSELETHFGEDAPLFVDMLAATSPNATVASNVTLALKAYTQYKSGKPFEGFMPAVIGNLERAVKGEPFGGPKVSSFKANLFGDPEPVTVDRWMARAMGKPTDTLTPAQYKFYDYTLTQIAKKAGVEPRQLQAGIWKAIKEAEGRAGNTSEAFEEVLARNVADKPELKALLEKLRSRGQPAEGAPPTGTDWNALGRQQVGEMYREYVARRRAADTAWETAATGLSSDRLAPVTFGDALHGDGPTAAEQARGITAEEARNAAHSQWQSQHGQALEELGQSIISRANGLKKGSKFTSVDAAAQFLLDRYR